MLSTNEKSASKLLIFLLKSRHVDDISLFNVQACRGIPRCIHLSLDYIILLIFISKVSFSCVLDLNIADRNIIDNICDLYQKSNRVISDFRVCDSNTLDSLHRTYWMHLYGCELWDLNCNYIKALCP